MIGKFKSLQLKTLDQHIATIRFCERPSDGWISAIRKSISMSVRQLGVRMGATQQMVSRFEQNECDDSITLRSLRKIAEAMNCKLVYAIIPREGTLKDIINQQALLKAREIIDPVNHTMMLEAQEVGDKDEKIKEIATDLVNNLNSKIWD